MYAVVVQEGTHQWRGCYFTHREDAMDYAATHTNVVAVEHIGVGFIWEIEREATHGQ
jgi:hypothetical protein